MDIKEINIIGDFEAGLKCLQNPSLTSRFSPPLHRVPQLYSFWKWGALIFAIFATFTGVINRTKLFILRIRVGCRSFLVSSSSSVQNSATAHQFFFGDDYDDSDYSSDGDDDDDSTAPSHSDDEQDFDRSEDEGGFSGDVFRVTGSGIKGSNRFSWSDFSAGKSVVQLWDSFGLGLDFDEDPYGDGISVWDLDQDVKLNSGRNIRIPSLDSSSAAVSLSAAMDDDDGVVLRAYDTRADGESPAIYATWKPRQRKISRPRVVGVTPPPKKSTGFEEDTWDAGAIIRDDELLSCCE